MKVLAGRWRCLCMVWIVGMALALPLAVLGEAGAATATIKGKVTFEGAKPDPYKLDMAAEKHCHEHHKSPVFAQKTVVGPGNEVQWAFVYVAKGLDDKTFPTPETPVTIDQQGCMYMPHVFGVQVDQKIDIVNSDPLLHNIHSLPKDNAGFNLAQPMKGMKSTKAFNEVEKEIKFKCDVHPWMSAYCFVLKHPFYAVTNEKGEYEIKNVPVGGKCGISVWHEEWKAKGKMVELKAGETKQLDFVLKAGE